jgi:hypothetical protein
MGITNENLYFKPSLRVINDEQISQIHGATLEVSSSAEAKLPRTRVAGSHVRPVSRSRKRMMETTIMVKIMKPIRLKSSRTILTP